MRRTLFAVCAVAVIAPAFWPPLASAPVEVAPGRDRVELKLWQASRVARANADLTNREAYRVRYMRRLSPARVLVCWRDEPYIEEPGEVDIGCDRVELRGREFWLYDDSILGLGWRRWL